jgi:hypothetical protein
LFAVGPDIAKVWVVATAQHTFSAAFLMQVVTTEPHTEGGCLQLALILPKFW